MAQQTGFQFTDSLHDLLEQVEKGEDEKDEFRPVPRKSYIPELEEKIAHWMAITPNLPVNTVKRERVIAPEFKNPHERVNFWNEQVRRCKHGYDGICGKMYFFFNFCKMENLGKGKIYPQYREVDNQWFIFLDTCQRSKEWGVICVKRRRVGMSWKAAADVVHDALFNKNRHIGMNSKTDIDSQLLLLKVKFIVDNLPPELQVPTTAGNSRSLLDFSYFITDVVTKHRSKRGNNSDIRVVAPTDNAYEGRMLSKWICDEAGKIDNLRAMWTYTEDCLLQETRRVGMPVIFGTSGDVGKEGKDLKEMWKDAPIYKLKRFFFAGWNGLAVDEYGNDLKEECIRWIIYKRHELAQASDESLLNIFIQKYPLCIPDAFNYTDSAGIGYRERIQAQMHSLYENPAECRTGSFRRNLEGEVEFVPNPHGKAIVYEHPTSGAQALYIAGIDPTDHDDAHEEASDLSMYVMARRNGTSPPKIVFEYTDRPDKAEDFYDQAIMALIYYNKAKALIERNRYRMIAAFEEKGFKYLVATTPQGITRLFGTKAQTMGIHMTTPIKEYLRQLLQEYVKYHCEIIPSYDLLEEFMLFGAKNTDKAMAFGICLIYLKDDKRTIHQNYEEGNNLPKFGYKLHNGRIQRYTDYIKPE